jgi:hypothetical protein
MPPTTIDHVKSLLTVAGYLGSFVLLLIGVLTYLRTEKWKRAEFLANEMKEFFSNSRVQKALLLIDWGCRNIQLLEDRPADQSRVVVTRQMQTMALRPHILMERASSLIEYSGSDVETFVTDEAMSAVGFTQPQAAIRDCYDAFLDGLERFASYARTGLIDIGSLQPYIGYWIDNIYSRTDDPDDAAWCAALLTYMRFYQFDGVLWLFDAFGAPIRPSSATYVSFLKGMKDQRLASQLAQAVERVYPVSEA